MQLFTRIAHTFTRKERVWFWITVGTVLISGVALLVTTVDEKSSFVPVEGGVYTEGAVGQPMIINPVVSANAVDQDLSALLFAPLSDLLSIPPDVSPDGKTYTLKLKEGLLWDDGLPLKSDDVMFTLKTIQDPGTHSPFEPDWQGVVAERVSEIQVRLFLPMPYTFFENSIARLRIIPQHIFGAIPIQNLRLSSYNLQPVGNGPYRFKDFSKRKDGFITRYRLVRNDRYIGKRPLIDEFIFQFYERWSDLRDDFKFRRIEGYGSLAPAPRDIPSHILTSPFPMPRYYAIFFNSVTNSALKDKNIRYALAYAIDKEKIAREILNTPSLAIDSPFLAPLIREMRDAKELGVDTFSLNAEEAVTYDPEKARALLASTKTPEISLTITIPAVGFLESAAKIIKQEWLEIGIKNVEVITLPADELDNAIRPRNYEVLLFGNVLQNPIDLFPFWHSSQRFYPGLNLALYQNIELDKQLEALRQNSDPTKNQARLEEINRMLLDDMPAIFLFSLPYTYLHTDKLGGVTGTFFTVPADRFNTVTEWYVTKARIINK
ncbi:MAG: ABC transporter substrate-binding protein [Patescibacteria group bacterium]|mgnify:FL=1